MWYFLCYVLYIFGLFLEKKVLSTESNGMQKHWSLLQNTDKISEQTWVQFETLLRSPGNAFAASHLVCFSGEQSKEQDSEKSPFAYCLIALLPRTNNYVNRFIKYISFVFFCYPKCEQYRPLNDPFACNQDMMLPLTNRDAFLHVYCIRVLIIDS